MSSIKKRLEDARNCAASMRVMFGYIPSYIGQLDDLTEEYRNSFGDRKTIEGLEHRLRGIEKKLSEDRALLADGCYLLNSEVTPEYLNALYYEYELLRDSGIDDPRLEMAADIIGSLNSHLEMRIDESNKGEVFYAMCSVQLAYDSMFAGLPYSEVFPYA